MAKGRESGMPGEGYWASFFDPSCVLTALGCDERVRDVVEFGCGYGTFTLAGRPGKGAGIRAAEALNTILGVEPVPHLWNTVTLAGDLRHRGAPDRDTVSRQEWENRAIAAKYAPGAAPASGVLTDTAPAVAALALETTERLLQEGVLAVARVLREVLHHQHLVVLGRQRVGAAGHDPRELGAHVRRHRARRGCSGR